MSSWFRALAIVMLVGSCSSGTPGSAPRNLDDACKILQDRPDFVRAFRATERKWDVPVAVQMAIIYQESKFIANARTPMRYTLGVIPMGRQSTAFGYAQALDGTWEEYKQLTGKRFARRTDIDDATEFMGWYMNGTTRQLNIPLTDARNQYLAYHEGRTGYKRGNYRNKTWLLRVSREVSQRAGFYDVQIKNCRGIRL